MKSLVIVESPAKAKKIESFLGSEYIVKSSVGHIRDLPVPSKLPAKVKEERDGAFKRFAVDVNNDFEPRYEILYGKNKVVTDLKAALKKCDQLLLATDEDREGEAIAWHLLDVLKPKVPVKRMVFHEITKEAIFESLNHTREIDYDLVDAQETRRILDRLFGFQVSPFLWRKFGTGLSAGRVQSVTTRILVDREKERIAFKKAAYGSLEAVLTPHDGEDLGTKFTAKLTHYNSHQVAVAKDFTDEGVLDSKGVKNSHYIISSDSIDQVTNNINSSTFNINEINKKAYTSRPKPPFTTSTLQQAAINRLKVSSQVCMRAAQILYENGYITYMRTDSPTLSQQAISTARDIIVKTYGPDSIPAKSRQYSAKQSNAQEAHEAIRPAGSAWLTPESLVGKVGDIEQKVYELIYRRTLSSQMNDAKGWTTSLIINAINDDKIIATLRASGTILDDFGYLKAYNDLKKDDEENGVLPDVKEGDSLDLVSVEANMHETKPPARFTEASLVRKMEELGIGRPSTYAATISTITNRGYVVKRGQQLIPTWLAFGVIRVLEQCLSEYVDYEFTANMEDDLDKIADGETKRNQWLHDFWFGDEANIGLEKETDALKKLIANKEGDDVFEVGASGRYQVRMTPYGAFLEDTAGKKDEEGRFPRGYMPLDDDKIELAPDELNDELIAESIATGVGLSNTGKILGKNPDTGYEIVATAGKYGPYFTEILPEGTPTKGKGAIKAKTASLLSYMTLETVDLADALKAFQIPRELGINPGDNEKIVVNNGRFGPYLMKKDPETKKYDYRSIKKTETETAEDRMFSITFDEAVEIYSQPKVYRRRKGGRK